MSAVVFFFSWSADPLHLTASLLKLLKDIEENDRFVTSLYIEKCFKVSGI